jgi:hypothetical protein
MRVLFKVLSPSNINYVLGGANYKILKDPNYSNKQKSLFWYEACHMSVWSQQLIKKHNRRRYGLTSTQFVVLKNKDKYGV